MGLRDLIANGVALADRLTADLQPVVQFRPWIGTDGFGKSMYDAATPVPAIVELKQRMVRTPAGEEVLSTHVITILRPIAPNGAPGRIEPIDTRDWITLSDGTTGPILSVGGFQDPEMDRSYFSQVWLAAG